MQDSHTVTRHLLAVGAQPINPTCRSCASDRILNSLYHKCAKEDSVPFSIKGHASLNPTQHNLYPNRAKMPGPIVHNETTATNLGGFVTILANLTRRAYALEEPPRICCVPRVPER